MSEPLFEYAAGTVIGRDHRLDGRNNQDAFHFDLTYPVVAVVCDGCSSGQGSEVGAQLGSRLLVAAARRHLMRWGEAAVQPENHTRLFQRIRQDLLTDLHQLARQMDDSLSAVIDRYFLFTVVGAIVLPKTSLFFALGDGVLMVNDERISLGPFPNNAPPYLGYSLVESALTTEQLSMTVHCALPTNELERFLLGTDGVADLERAAELTVPGKDDLVGSPAQFWEDRYYGNEFLLGRRLALINRDHVRYDSDSGVAERVHGRLPDDTTLIVGRRKGGAA